MLLGEPPFQERARIDAWCSMSLKIHQIAWLVAVLRMEKMVEPDLHQSRQRGIGRNVAADAAVVLVLPHHHGHRVPAREALDTPLDGAVSRIGNLGFRR